MFDKIIEILIYVIGEFERTHDIERIDMQPLFKQGFTNLEISTAISWFYDNVSLKPSAYLDSNDNKSFRILNPDEQAIFSSSAWADIIQLHSLGIISNDDIETIIDKVTFSGPSKIDKPLLRQYIAFAIFNADLAENRTNKYLLDINDTIH